MSAHDEIRKQLDALMGADRNERKTEKKSFLEPDICKNYLLGCCPYELFTSTVSRISLFFSFFSFLSCF